MRYSDEQLLRMLNEEAAKIAARAMTVWTGDWAADGGTVGTTWHQGESEEQVYYERYRNGQRTAHGWIDAASRDITQTG